MRLGYKIGIFIPFLAIFLMSHNASAFDINTPVTLKDTIKQPYISYNYVGGSNQTSYSNSAVTRSTTDPNITRIFFKDTTNHNIAFNAGDYIVFNVYFVKTVLGTQSDNVYPASFFSTIGSNPSCDIIDITWDAQPYIQGQLGGNSTLYERYNGKITCHTNTSGTNPSINLFVRSNLFTDGQTAVQSIQFSFSSMSIYTTVEEHDVNAEQEEATQEASDNSQDVADENSESEQSSNLIGILQALLNSLTGLSATNCNVDLAFPSSLGGTMSVNICQNKDKAGTIISVFGSITLVVFYLPLAMKLLSMIYNEIRSFTNG